MKTYGLALLLMLCVFGLLWQGGKIRRLENERWSHGAGFRSDTSVITASKSDSKEEISALRQELARLRRQLGERLRHEVDHTSDPVTNSPLVGTLAGNSLSSELSATNAWYAGLVQSIGSSMAQYFEGQMSRARQRLGLNEGQEQAMRDTVARAFDKGKSDLERVLTGQARPEEVPTMEEWARALEKDILSGLTPEQQALYLQYKREDLTAYSRVSAQTELLALQEHLGLTPEQQDGMLAVIFDQTLNRLDLPQETDQARPREPLAAARYYCEQRLDALQAVLTTDQLDRYAQLQNVYLKYWEGVLMSTGPNNE
jgi:hypothetical protein